MKYLLLCLSVSLALCLSSTAFGASSTSVDQRLQELEEKFFQHTFPKESKSDRLTRLEKFTFGESGNGTVEGRLSKISSVVEESTKFDPSEKTSKPKLANKKGQAKQPDTDPAATGDYPHITFLEDELLGAEHLGEPIAQRLSRLENHAFGKVSTDPDMSARTDDLEKYAVTALHKRPFIREKINHGRTQRSRPHFPAAFPSVNPDDLAAAQDNPPSPHERLLTRVAWCEKHTLGRTYPELHLLQRLHQLNANLFPQDKEKDVLLMDRIDAMVKKVVLIQHPPTTAYK